MGLVFNITLYSRIMVDWSVENITLDMILFRMSKDVGVINKRSNKHLILITLMSVLLRFAASDYFFGIFQLFLAFR
jgi:hypothetical protein